MIRHVRSMVVLGALASAAGIVPLVGGCANGADKGGFAAGSDASDEGLFGSDDGGASSEGGNAKDGTAGDGSGGHDGAGGGDGGKGTDSAFGGDGPMSGDSASGGDGASGGDSASGTDGSVAQGSCTPGQYRCGVGNSVEVCNSSGTSWLYSATCTASCSGGLCTGACVAGETRCNGNNVETCNAGTAWAVSASCTGTFCSAGECARNGLDVALNTTLDGVVYVQGAVDVHSGATLSSPTGKLTIYADSITVENGGLIAAAPTGKTAAGAGGNGTNYDYYYYPGGGGGYGTTGNGIWPGQSWGSTMDSDVEPGSPGGNGIGASAMYGGYGGAGGGVLRLFAKSITIAGQVTANGNNGQADTGCTGDGGGGSGGGVLIGADNVTITGSVTTAGGSGGAKCSSGTAGTGGSGRVKVLWGSAHSITGTLTGTVTQGLLPPIPITSTSHPDPSLTYNDDFPSLLLSWTHAFPSVQGYFVSVDTNASNPPTPSTGKFFSTDFTSFPPASLVAGDNYFHITPMDAMSNVGTVETVFHVSINTSAPSVTSQSHPDPTMWSTNTNPYFAWTFPQGDANVTGIYYLLDHDGSTVPTTAATFLPVTQKQQLLSNLAAGVWVFHAVSVDQRGYLTKASGNYRVNIGTDPGSGGVLGTVVDSGSMPVTGANVTINNGLFPSQMTNGSGNYNFTSIPAGSWTVSVTSGGKTASAPVTVTAGSATTANLTLP